MGLTRRVAVWGARRMVRTMRDPDVPLVTKLGVLGAALYLLSPLDAVPDMVPLGGWLDDAIVAALAWRWLARDRKGGQPGPGGPGRHDPPPFAANRQEAGRRRPIR